MATNFLALFTLCKEHYDQNKWIHNSVYNEKHITTIAY